MVDQSFDHPAIAPSYLNLITMSEEYHSVTFTVPVDECLPPFENIDVVDQLHNTCGEQIYASNPPYQQISASTTRVGLSARSRKGMAGESIEAIVKGRYAAPHLRFLTSERFDFARPHGGISSFSELVFVLDMFEVQAALLDLRQLLEWCESTEGSEMVASLIVGGYRPEGIREMVRDASVVRVEWWTLESGNSGYIFDYLSHLVMMFEFAKEKFSSVVQIYTVDREYSKLGPSHTR